MSLRMGDNQKRSALDAWNRMHEVKNVLVVGGSAFTAASEKNPTLTILAREEGDLKGGSRCRARRGESSWARRW